MRILIVNRALGTLFGGGESFDYNAARQLMARGHQVTLITGRPFFSVAPNQYQDVKVVFVPSPSLRRYAYATERLHSKVSAAFYHLDNALFERAVLAWYAKRPAGSFDIVQCCSLFTLPERLLTQFGQPVVSWLPGPPSGRVRKFLPSLAAQPKFGLFTHGSTEWALNELGFSRGCEFEIIEPGISLAQIDAVAANRDAIRAQLGMTASALVGITTARLVSVKNHRLLLNALAQARQQGVLWHWIFIGDGPLAAELKALAQVLRIADYIYFLGHQTQDDVHTWLSVADLFALTSNYESFSIATVEAMAHRLPIIGTQVGYLQQLIIKSGAGLAVPANDSAQLAEVLKKLAEPEARKQYGKHGRAFVERLDWPVIATKLERLYQDIIADRIN